MGETILLSASSVLSLLDESDNIIQQYALQQLNTLVDQYWAEIATYIPRIETLYESNTQQTIKQLAAIVVSKVFYHLDELNDSLKYALAAGQLFNTQSTQNTNNNQYIDTLISKCIDQYIELRNGNTTSSNNVDDRLISVIESMFERCISQGEYKQAIGIAIESRRLDIVKRVIDASGRDATLLNYILTCSNRVIVNKSFRTELLSELIELYRLQSKIDYLHMCICLQQLDDSTSVAQILNQLITQDNDESTLIAYQIAFDLSDNQHQPFLNMVSKSLPETPTATNITNTTPTNTTTTDDSTAENTNESTPLLSQSTAATDKSTDSSYAARLINLKDILSGAKPVSLYLNFLYKQHKTDLNILRQIKDKLEQRNSVTHNATVIAHSFMHAGTTVDQFLRENLEWLGKATNWAKFTAIASLGVIHQGHHKDSMKLLQPYLPGSTGAGAGAQAGSPYQEGGALYALGLIHAQYGADKLPFLITALKSAADNEIIQHGACLGIGLCGMASNDRDTFELLKNTVMSESAVAGEAAGYSMGLVMLGSNNDVCIEEMLAYAHDTQHEKIIRGLGLGIAFMLYGCEESADTVIEQLINDKDSILRYGGMFAIAMAYAGTSNNAAIEKLLHVAVTDVEDEVRRSAVTALGFVLSNQPEQVPRVVQLLAESYNPHVRYGACMAVGIACAGGPDSCRTAAINVLEPLLKDRVDLVRQAALIAMSMVLIEHNETDEPKLSLLRKTINDTMSVKADTMTKLGAILSSGIVDAGGRNVTIALLTQSGQRRMAAIVGMTLFTQFWYWYPLTHFLSLSFQPTAIIGLNKNLQLPKQFSILSLAAPSKYQYVPMIDLSEQKKKVEVKHATLSVSSKKKHTGDKMNIDEQKSPSNTTDTKTTEDTEMKSSEDSERVEQEKKDAAAKILSDAKYQRLSNPSRVTWSQQSVLHTIPNTRYHPVKQQLSGIVMLIDSKPNDTEELVETDKVETAVPGIDTTEPAVPQPFALPVDI